MKKYTDFCFLNLFVLNKCISGEKKVRMIVSGVLIIDSRKEMRKVNFQSL